jgi:hypothetical protein
VVEPPEKRDQEDVEAPLKPGEDVVDPVGDAAMRRERETLRQREDGGSRHYGFPLR